MACRIDRLPQDDHSNGWSALLPKRIPRASLTGQIQADWLVIGAGYAGIAAARQLAQQQPQASIAVVEAGVVGENASGRNSGFALSMPNAHRCSPEIIARGQRSIRVNRFALEELNRLVKTHAIECDWQASGRYHVAVSPAIAERDLRAYAQNLQAWDEPVQWLDRQQLQARLGTDYYSAGVYTPGAYLMNPAALVRGLADSLPAQVRLFENSPVIEAELHGTEPWVRTAQGSVRAGGVILAVNAFTQAFGVYGQRQIPILLFASLTHPLTAAQRARLGSDASWGLTPSVRISGSTLRLTADGRLLMRQGFAWSPGLHASDAQRARARAINLRLLRQRFPQLGNLELEHFWMGWIPVSRNHAPAFGQVAERTWAVSCCNGSGIVRHTAAGMLIADQALGRENPLIDDFLAQGQASYIPPQPWRSIGVYATLLWNQWQARREQ